MIEKTGEEIMVIGCPIFATAIYKRKEAAQVTGFSESTLRRADGSVKVSNGKAKSRPKLQVRYTGETPYYLGVDLLRWLGGDEVAEKALSALMESGSSSPTSPTKEKDLPTKAEIMDMVDLLNQVTARFTSVGQKLFEAAKR